MFAGKKSAQIREILINESAWEEMTCLFALSLATGYLDLSTGSIEAVFTLPQYTGKGLGSQIIEAIKSEARGRGFEQLTLSSTPNAQTFYEKHGFKLMQESMYPSALAQAELRCMEMSINLLG